MGKGGQDDLRSRIAREEALFAELDRQRDTTRARLQSLRSRTGAIASDSQESPSSASSGIRVPITTAEKLALFRGREYVFPRLWANGKKGAKGYAPACFNEWVRGVCEKPRVKCGECPNQAFIPVEDQVILDHLQGRHVADGIEARAARQGWRGCGFIGVYPLFEDETCWFLAVDFDKASWQEDAGAFVETGRGVGRACGRRALALGQRRARVVLLFCSGSGHRSAQDGQLRRWPGATSSAWNPMIGCFQTRTRSHAAASET